MKQTLEMNKSFKAGAAKTPQNLVALKSLKFKKIFRTVKAFHDG